MYTDIKTILDDANKNNYAPWRRADRPPAGGWDR